MADLSHNSEPMIETIQPIPAFPVNNIWAVSGEDNKQLCGVDQANTTPELEYLAATDLILTKFLFTHRTDGASKLTTRYSPRKMDPHPSKNVGSPHPVLEGDHVELFGRNHPAFQSAEIQLERSVNDNTEFVATIRQWKDNF